MNWDYETAGIVTGLNRTCEELKLSDGITIFVSTLSLNRTCEELKLIIYIYELLGQVRLNRTCEELKHEMPLGRLVKIFV